jgi:hypothetical protein
MPRRSRLPSTARPRRRAARARAVLRGILNGIDIERWDPARDPSCAAPYDADDLAGKASARRAAARLRPADPRARPLFGMVTRLAEQKGIDILSRRLPDCSRTICRSSILGRGDERYEQLARGRRRRDPTRLASGWRSTSALAPGRGGRRRLPHALAVRALRPQSDVQPALRHVPSCGPRAASTTRSTTSTPIPRRHGLQVRRVLAGGADRDRPARARPLRRSVGWQRIMREGMRRDHSWQRAAGAYLESLRELLARR